MFKLISVAVFGGILAAQATVDYPQRPMEQEIDAHDPAVLKDDNFFYIYGTHNMPVWRSPDLIAFDRVEQKLVRRLPEEAAQHVGEGARTLWAPDVVKVGNEYRLYYCLSRFGTSQSYIGFLAGKSPTGPYQVGEEVLRSFHPPEEKEGSNALDPSILIDEHGKQWMVYGSFFGGIYIFRLDDDGESRSKGSLGKRIAFRENTAMEGACVLHHPGLKKYFLFVSYDKLDSTYNVRVGRSDRPDGPYRDFNGDNLAGEEDNIPKILNSYAFENHSGWHGPGHNSVLRDKDDYFMLHHARENGRVHTHVRKMVFTDEGWPVVSPERYAGEREQSIPGKEMIGEWEFLPINPDDNTMQHAVTGLRFEEDGLLTLGNQKGKWQLKEPNSLRFFLGDDSLVSAKVLPAWDWENDKSTLVFTGLNKDGIAVWGKKRESD